jgi:hypothetical protein
MDMIAMDPDLKTKVKSDLQLFLKDRAVENRLGRSNILEPKDLEAYAIKAAATG